MAEPTLTQVFGAGASQTATTITLTKADLTGLVASSTNRAEELFVAIMLKAAAYLNETQRQLDPVNVNVSISAGLPQFVIVGGSQYRRDILQAALYKLDGGENISPGNY